MTERTDPNDAALPESVAEQPAGGMPRWVKISLIVVVALVALFVVLNVAGVGPKHGPGRHMPQQHGIPLSVGGGG